MMEKTEVGSIERIAADKWGDYKGDIQMMSDAERRWGVEAHDLVTAALQANFIEGFKQGVLLRLTGDTNAHG
jgi:hypothetical protein